MNGIAGSGFTQIGTIFFNDGYALTQHFLAKGISSQAILELMYTAYESIDSLITSFINRCKRENRKVACHRGCAFCCNQAVLASNHEILVIKNFLDAGKTEHSLDGIRRRCISKDRFTSGMKVMEFLHFKHPCPFLRDNSCLIYEVRPMACRCYLSSDIESCISQYEQPGNRNKLPALYDFPLRAGRGMNEGIRSGLMERGLIPSEWLLETFMAKAFGNDSIFDDWLKGGTPFNIRTLEPDENRYLRDYYQSPEN